MKFISSDRSDQIFGGFMLAGIGILFMVNWFWPGILYVTGISLIARSVNEGKRWTDNTGALLILVVAIFFSFISLSGNLLSLILILAGLYLLFGSSLRKGSDKSKRDIV